MDRQIVYPGQIPLETDLLNTNKFAMIGLAKLASAILGNNTWLYGLACTPTAPASMAVTVSDGQIYSLQNIDGTPYSSLAADTMNSILKQGFHIKPASFSLSAPGTPGHSINYLIQVTYSDTDADPVILKYYNADKPSMAFNGPAGSNDAQSTVRAGRCSVYIKTGISARTGQQVTPAPDAGCIGAWVVSVQYGAGSIEAANIRMADGAPFLPVDGIISAIQKGQMTFGQDTGTPNHYKVTYMPGVESVSNGMRLHFRAANTNTGVSFLAVDSMPESRILTAAHEELTAEQIIQGRTAEIEWNSTHEAWILCSSPGGYSKRDSDKRYYSRAGGEISGDVDIDGNLSVGKELKIGKAVLSATGDINGDRWKGSLYDCLIRNQPNINENNDGWYYKNSVSGFAIQGGIGRISRASNHVHFPVKYPVDCFSVLITQDGKGKNKMSRDNISVSDVKPFGFSVHLGSGEPYFYWVAFGK